jgi:hypothetical protein
MPLRALDFESKNRCPDDVSILIDIWAIVLQIAEENDEADRCFPDAVRRLNDPSSVRFASDFGSVGRLSVAERRTN